ncbi:hypothetical protein [Salinicoccus sp. YB14-2]|uniref:hypothetical protein n=1 Tax=Salinicoccus sp. YB14-2 TaxID=1572701 RepID=UPI0009E50CE4|nr:hypothetical protein [Salinicoccus sp. YB14-2]
MRQIKKPSLLQLLLMNLATILFVSGLVFINVAMYYIFDTYIGLLTTGITLLVVGLIINHEQSITTERR